MVLGPKTVVELILLRLQTDGTIAISRAYETELINCVEEGARVAVSGMPKPFDFWSQYQPLIPAG